LSFSLPILPRVDSLARGGGAAGSPLHSPVTLPAASRRRGTCVTVERRRSSQGELAILPRVVAGHSSQGTLAILPRAEAGHRFFLAFYPGWPCSHGVEELPWPHFTRPAPSRPPQVGDGRLLPSIGVILPRGVSHSSQGGGWTLSIFLAFYPGWSCSHGVEGLPRPCLHSLVSFPAASGRRGTGVTVDGHGSSQGRRPFFPGEVGLFRSSQGGGWTSSFSLAFYPGWPC